MNDLITVFRMDELSIETRVRIIIKLGGAINHRYGGNVTEPIVYELVKALDPNNMDVEKEHYLKHIKK